MENKELIHIFVDESGTFHDGETEYFVLGGIVISDKYKEKIKRKYKEYIKDFVVGKSGVGTKRFELKSTSFKKKRYSKQIEIVEKLDEYLNGKEAKMFSLVVDVKKHKRNSNLDEVKNIKNSENMRYNYFLKVLIQKLIEKYSDFLENKDIILNVNCDARTTKVSAKNELCAYLRLEISSVKEEINEIIVKYHDSTANYLIQIADIVAGLKFKQFNRVVNFKDGEIDRIINLKNIVHIKHN